MKTTWYQSPWFVASVAIIVTYLATPVLDVLFGWIRSRRGKLTGTYLALTRQEDQLVAERVRCWHIGQRLRGRIQGVALIRPEGGRVRSYEPIQGTYTFVGRRIGRVLLLQYWDRSGTDQAGTIALNVQPPREQLFLGTWAGMTSEGLTSASCLWVRVQRRDFPVRDANQFVNGVDAALEAVAALTLLGFQGHALRDLNHRDLNRRLIIGKDARVNSLVDIHEALLRSGDAEQLSDTPRTRGES